MDGMTRCEVCKRPVAVPGTGTGTGVLRDGKWSHRACIRERDKATETFNAGYAEGAQGERAAVVAWLRAIGSVMCLGLADDIEEGVHGEES